MIIADRRQLLNGNSFILGVSGSGKSFTGKNEIVSVILRDPNAIQLRGEKFLWMNDLSTYSSHLLNMKNMMKAANSETIILIDEFGTQVVLQTLFVTDVYHDVLENTCLGTLAHRDAQSALQHILKQTGIYPVPPSPAD